MSEFVLFIFPSLDSLIFCCCQRRLPSSDHLLTSADTQALQLTTVLVLKLVPTYSTSTLDLSVARPARSGCSPLSARTPSRPSSLLPPPDLKMSWHALPRELQRLVLEAAAEACGLGVDEVPSDGP